MKIKSVFEQISEEVFKMKNLEEAKTFVIVFIKSKKINEKNKQTILLELNCSKNLIDFQKYICNSLLKYEGMGMNKLFGSTSQPKSEI